MDQIKQLTAERDKLAEALRGLLEVMENRGVAWDGLAIASTKEPGAAAKARAALASLEDKP